MYESDIFSDPENTMMNKTISAIMELTLWWGRIGNS